MKKRVLSILSVLSVLLSLVPAAFAGNAYTINDVTVQWTDFSSSPSECWVYANRFYKKIWGQNFSQDFNDESNFLRELSDEELTLTAEHLESYVRKAVPGSVLRICSGGYLHGSDGWGHSQLIVSSDKKGFTVFEGGLYEYPYRREKYYTWDEYINTAWLGGSYYYIKYIKWPNAGTYSPYHDPVGALETVTGGKGTIHIRGWAFDYDEPETGIPLRVYAGTTFLAEITADGERIDVPIANTVEYPGIGKFHGFDTRLETELCGEQKIEVYAVSVGGGGADVLLGSGTVTVEKQKTGFFRRILDAVNSFFEKLFSH